MPLSLNLPYPLCLASSRFLRRLRKKTASQSDHDPEAYFADQYASTRELMDKYMRGIVLKERVVIDIGSGLGGRAPYWLEAGAKRVLNVDINRLELTTGQDIVARKHPVLSDQIVFLHPDEIPETAFADVAIMFDCFEHLVDPAPVLRQAHAWLRDGGVLWIGSMGWYNYYASHCLAHVPIPWCQVLFSERAIIRTIQTITRDPEYLPNYWERTEGITRWDDVASLRDRPGEPLNMLSLRQVRKVLADSPFAKARFEVHGFSGKAHRSARMLGRLARVPVVNELFHSYYTAVLTKVS